MHARPARVLASVICSLFVAATGCREPAPKDPTPAPSAEGGGGGGLPFSPLAGMFASKLDEPGPYEAPRASADHAEGTPALGVVAWEGTVSEVAGMSLFGGASTPLRDLIAQLDAAAADANTTGLAIRIGDLGIDLVAAEELRHALADFRSGGKPAWCHAERLTDTTYHVATACSRIGLAPLGELAITGPAATPIHVKGLLDRVGVTADFLHVGAFKGAAEPITRDAPSPEMLETLGAIVERRWASQLDAIGAARGLDHAGAVAAVDRGLFVGDDAIAAKLVDEVAPWETFRDHAAQGQPWRELRRGGKLADFATLQRFLGLLPPVRPSEPHVAVVFAVGNIVDGSGSGLVGAREEIASHTLVAALRAIAADDAVKAVVLRVDSGGGSALASEQIWHAAEALGERKPLVVSMGSAAASGGYYISAPAARIFAGADTLTGSIGVVGGKLVFGDALAQLGVNTFEVHRGERALMWSSMKPWTDAERSTVESMMRATYDTFVARVAEGRKLDRAAVEAIAQGRVWTGADAKARGLVDAIGTLDDAVADAETRGGVAPGTPLEIYPPEPTLRDILAGFGQVQSNVRGDAVVEPAALLLAHLLGPSANVAGLLDPRVRARLQTMLSTLVALRSARIWAASPALWWTW
jgi:protease-4